MQTGTPLTSGGGTAIIAPSNSRSRDALRENSKVAPGTGIRITNHQELERFYDRYAGQAITRLRTRLPGPNPEIEAMDVMQELFVGYSARVRAGDTVPPRDEPPIQEPIGWLVVVAARALIDRDRKAPRMRSCDAGAPTGTPDVRDPSARRAESVAILQEKIEKLEKAIAALDSEERKLVEHIKNGDPVVEIARAMGWPYDRTRDRVRGLRSRLNLDLGEIYSEAYDLSDLAFAPAPERREHAITVIRRLPPDERAVVERHHVLKQSMEEIARAIGFSVRTCRDLLARGEELLARKYGMKMPDDLVAALARGEAEVK